MSLVAETATVVHGFTMADIDNAARVAVRMAGRVMDPEDAYATAWHGIVEHLFSETEAPLTHHLFTLGKFAILNDLTERQQFTGYNHRIGGPGHRFVQYWGTPDVEPGPDVKFRPAVRPMRHASDFTEGLVDKLALPELLGRLNDDEYEAIVTLAALGSQKRAAAALAVNENTLKGRLRRARDTFIAAWLEPDTPPAKTKIVDLELACRYGHPRSHDGRRQPDGKWTCRKCERNRARRYAAKGTASWQCGDEPSPPS